MPVTIANERLTFVSDDHGAELHTLRFTDEALDYMWMPDTAGPAMTSTCFPLLGTVPGGRYVLAGREYEMPMHGFAKDTVFDVVEHRDDTVTYEMTDSEATRRAYPYRFRLRVRYRLDAASLVTEYVVDNLGDDTMLYSVGSHPRFACPVDPDDDGGFADHGLAFTASEGPEKLVRTFGPRETVDAAFSADRRRLRLGDDLFTDGAFCFASLNSDAVVLDSDRSRRALRLDLGGASHLQVWSVPGSPFVALEPWFGAISGNPPTESDRFWDRRAGTLALAPGESRTHAFRITPIR
jgi:galactose mutarotase-like enzyme